ncbi:MAG: hypothetical protein IPG31_11975 [Nitrosomonas sp.]|nr:hypothetical protein [Nitrosomonas sp.]
MCFPQTSLRAEPNKFNNIMLDHHLIISEEDHFKEGLVFVGFRLKSQPDTLWLFDGENWMKHSDADSLRPFFYRVDILLHRKDNFSQSCQHLFPTIRLMSASILVTANYGSGMA